MTQTQELARTGEERKSMEVRQQVNEIQYLMANVLKQGEHYGTIPGTRGKPTLMQAGAEKIAFMFKLVPAYEVTCTQLDGGHREYAVTCTLTQRGSGTVEGSGMGLCSTMESKYRYRKVGGKRQENPDIADTYNTVLKMAKKRAFVDAVKSTTAASDIFTQDIEDMPGWMASTPQEAPQEPPAQPARPPQADLDWLAQAADGLAAQGYKLDEVKPFLWARYQEGGKDGARAAYESMLAAVGQAKQEEAAQEPDEIELAEEDIEF